MPYVCGGSLFLYNVLFCKQNALCLIVDVFSSVAQLLVQHLVGGRETKAFKTEDFAAGVRTNEESLQVDGQTGTETEYLASDGEELALVLNGLVAEEAFRWSADDAHLVTFLTDEACTGYECANLGTIAHEYDIGVLVTLSTDVCTLAAALIGSTFGEGIDVLA